jgi:2-oxoglutarate dehydrogenase E2 component (dihydrolipoamide succinyltransferase)
MSLSPPKKFVLGDGKMATDVVMPQMGESIFEGTIVKWLKTVGDRVERDEPLLEISTDKVDAEIPAPLSGVLIEIRASEGQTVAVNTVVAVIGEAAGIAEMVPPAAAQPQSERLQPAVAQEPGQGAGPDSKEIQVDLKEDRALSSAAAQPLPGNVLPLSRMRRIIAQRMLESVQISPHAHTVYKVDMTRVVGIHKRERGRFEQRHGVKLTYLPFITTAVIAALRKYPVVNASLAENGIQYHASISLGIAVALDTGLMVPVIHAAEQCSLAELARAVADLAARARSKKLNPNEVTGSTFTITNNGIFGDELTTSIINQPNSAILCVSAVKKEPVVLTDSDGNDGIAIRSMQNFTLGFDHRLIDGADAGKFMLEIKRVLESWDKQID